MVQHPDLRLAVISAFFGFGVMWSEGSPHADKIVALVAPFDGNPLLERLEKDRVLHLLKAQGQEGELRQLRDLVARQAARLERQEELLQKMRDSSAFALAEQISRLRQRGRPRFSRNEVEQALRD